MLHPWATNRTLDGSYDQVFQATLETLKARGFPIERLDREGGEIETGKRPVDAMNPYQPVETVRAYVGRESERGTSVRLFLSFLEQRSASSGSLSGSRTRRQSVVNEAMSKSRIYDEYLDAISDRVQSLRGTKPAANPEGQK